jgi:8-oxo-dGTP pyrophosphatase MutT (NUDIX family)
MHRKPLLGLLERYAALHPGEADCVGRVRQLVQDNADCFERSCLPGHITASSWILSPDRRRFLMTHHRKLDRWLQLGGHADGDTEVAQVALREAQEESGMHAFEFLGAGADRAFPIDVDVHLIPARKDEPEHEHHDIRFLLVAGEGQALQLSDESNDLRWFETAALSELDVDESVLRMAAKVARLLG